MNEYILSCSKNTNLAESWIKEKYKIKPLIIHGNPGTGKTSIAKHILKDRTIVHITSDLCKTNIDFEGHLKLSLYKKSITMMFSKNSVYKALIVDDVTTIQKSDKKLYKSILIFSKKKVKHHPIIYIFDKINHKSLINLKKNSFQMNISYSKNDLIKITKKFLYSKQIDKKKLTILIENSNFNLHNIITNIKFYKDDFKNINRYENIDIELSDYINKIIKMNNFTDIYRYSETDFNIINLNLIENIDKIFNFKKNNLILLDKVYQSTCLGDNILTSIHHNNNWNSIEHQITFSIVCPIIQIKKVYKKDVVFDYTKYISKCIIYTYNNKLLNTCNINVNILSYLYYLIKNYLDKKTIINKDIIKKYIIYYGIPLKICEKFMKYYWNEYRIEIDKKIIEGIFKFET